MDMMKAERVVVQNDPGVIAVHPEQPEWIDHYRQVGDDFVPVYRPRAYAGNASIQRKRRQDHERAEG